MENTRNQNTGKIAFLGLGRMGVEMARRLVDAGYDPVLWNRTASRAELIPDATVAATPAEAVAGAGVVITMLADPAAVDAVVGELAGALQPGTVLVDMSSIGPAATLAVAARLPQDVTLVDAPVLGSTPAARAGTLVILAGGNDSDLDRVEAVLSTLGTVRRCGATGRGSAYKILVIGSIVASVAQIAESLRLAEALGIPRDDALSTLGAGPLGAIVGRATDSEADFPIRLAAKDLGLALGAAGDLPQLSAARERLLAAADQEADLSHILPA
ncbi:MAG TPA: NAD(P)-dependent oxidoreductase [Kribbellaceae bacterium]